MRAAVIGAGLGGLSAAIVLVLDAAGFSEIARAEVPHPVLFGCHGQFYDDLRP